MIVCVCVCLQENIPIEEVFENLRCTKEGLTSEAAQERLVIFGHNKLEEKKVKLIILCKFCSLFPFITILILLYDYFVHFILYVLCVFKVCEVMQFVNSFASMLSFLSSFVSFHFCFAYVLEDLAPNKVLLFLDFDVFRVYLDCCVALYE